MAPLVTMSRLLRLRSYYTVPQAGAQIGLGRTGSYDAAEAGLIPVERAGAGGKLMLVPRNKWDRQVKRLLLRAAKPPRSTAPRNLCDATEQASFAAQTQRAAPSPYRERC